LIVIFIFLHWQLVQFLHDLAISLPFGAERKPDKKNKAIPPPKLHINKVFIAPDAITWNNAALLETMSEETANTARPFFCRGVKIGASFSSRRT
jgi:hypothetical protein